MNSEVLKTQGEPIIFENQEPYMSKRIKSFLLRVNDITQITIKPNPYIPNEIKFTIRPNVCNIINLSQDTLIGSLFFVEHEKVENNQDLFINLKVIF